MIVLSWYGPADPFRAVDLFATHPVPFDELLEDADEVDVGSVAVPVASIGHLIRLKRISGRPRDLEGTDALTRIADGRPA